MNRREKSSEQLWEEGYELLFRSIKRKAREEFSAYYYTSFLANYKQIYNQTFEQKILSFKEGYSMIANIYLQIALKIKWI